MNKKNIAKVLKKVIENPLRYVVDFRALLKGCFYIAYFRAFKPRTRIRFPFFAYHKVVIKGPGTVLIDRNCSIYKNVLQGLCIVTLSPSAKVVIGRHCVLGGVTIRCRECVEMDENTMAGFSTLQDCLIAQTAGNQDRSILTGVLQPRSIKIGKNVWLGGRSCILTGTTIGDNSVVATGSVCYRSNIPEYCLVSGNPIMRPSPISRILEFRKKP